MGFKTGFNVSPLGKAGRLSLWWDDQLDVDISFSLKHVIDARVRTVGDD